jgi:hypothetical protein
MTVLGNVVEAPIRVRKLRRDEAMAIGEECLRRVQLIDKASEYPARLSGGYPPGDVMPNRRLLGLWRFPSARSRTVEFAEEERHGAGYCLF